MGWLERANHDLNAFLARVEHGWKPCFPPAPYCYFCSPHFMDMRMGVLGICIWQVVTGIAWVLLVQFFFNADGKAAMSSPFNDYVDISYNMVNLILSDLLQEWVHYFDLGFAGATVVMGAIGILAVSDADGIMHYTDRAMVKIVVYSRGCIMMALLSVLRLGIGLLLAFFTAAYALPWWWVAGIAAFSCYHAYVVWSFFAVLRRQYKGIFIGVPVMRGQAPPGVVVELTHFQEVDMVLQDIASAEKESVTGGDPAHAGCEGPPTTCLVGDQLGEARDEGTPKFLLFRSPSPPPSEANHVKRTLRFESQ